MHCYGSDYVTTINTSWVPYLVGAVGAFVIACSAPSRIRKSQKRRNECRMTSPAQECEDSGRTCQMYPPMACFYYRQHTHARKNPTCEVKAADFLAAFQR
ncbi:hypothetical protein Zmor_009181 [Zophobas morio]|uniref:Uncharacterized protein n=1 Tax=Zophobas morio TaxID=2755281 RepID=A0AA38INU4_9CUCU|nr:hypothetical protein Zmor_009181 [Zophobas morio]